MRVIEITARQAFRFSPRTPHRVDSLRADNGDFCHGVPNEPNFQRGTIDVYLADGPEGSRYARIWNPQADKLNGNVPMVTIIPLESVASWIPMSAAMEETLYPEAQRTMGKKAKDADVRGHGAKVSTTLA